MYTQTTVRMCIFVRRNENTTRIFKLASIHNTFIIEY